MIIPNESVLFEKIFAASGKIVAIPAQHLPRKIRQNSGAIIVSELNLSPQKTVFENISAPLAATGTPWETARERIARELSFWFPGKDHAEISRIPATETDLLRLALATACAAKPAQTPLILSGSQSGFHAIFGELRERAEKEHFAVIIESANYLTAREADRLVFFPKSDDAGNPDLSESIICSPLEAETSPEALCVVQFLRLAKLGGTKFGDNIFSGKLLGSGAGEFFAELPSGTQIHGKLCGEATEVIPENTTVEIFLPPEIFHLDVFPPEENFFELQKVDNDNTGKIFYDGRLYYRKFKTADGDLALNVAAQHRQSLEIPEGSPLYAWFFPEDAPGFPTNAE